MGYLVMGAIGVGKTTLLKSAAQANYATYPELVIGPFLADYILTSAAAATSSASPLPPPPPVSAMMSGDEEGEALHPPPPRRAITASDRLPAVATHSMAFSFQMAMMQAACTRTTDAAAQISAYYKGRTETLAIEIPCTDASDTKNSTATIAKEESHHQGYIVVPRGTLIERPAQENVLFARANYEAQRMTSTEWKAYARYMHQFAEALWAEGQLPKHRLVYPLLWAPETVTTDRMIARKRLAEDAYDDLYLQRLPHCYFIGFLEIALRTCQALVKDCEWDEQDEHEGPLAMFLKRLGVAAVSARNRAVHDAEFQTLRATPEQRDCGWHPVLALPIVIDWSNYGTWTDVLQQLHGKSANAHTADRILFDIGGVMLGVPAGTEDTCEILAPGVIKEKDPMKPLHLNLSWYLTHSRTDEDIIKNRHLLVHFRDTFFLQRARMGQVVFYLNPEDCALASRTMTLYYHDADDTDDEHDV
jgi:deoxyadenosine/deoxycytidine kinase